MRYDQENGLAGGGPIFVVKSWQAFLILLSWLILGIASYAKLDSQTSENQRRIQELEQRPVVTEQIYQQGQHAIEQRLDRIERKIDAADARDILKMRPR